MRSIAGIFVAREDAARVAGQLTGLGIPREHVSLLVPGNGEHAVEQVPTTETEQPGMGAVLGAVLGGATGISGGAAASILLPGVGPVIGIGLAAMALLGATGAVAGAAVGGALENSLADGLPRDELFVYEDALRQGRSVVLALTDDEARAERVREALSRAGAEDVDTARERWWIGLRDAEHEHYRDEGGEFTADEAEYRRGFEAALRPEARRATPVSLHVDAALEQRSAPYRRGYQRGRAYHEGLLARDRH
jgi:hypothetical protein